MSLSYLTHVHYLWFQIPVQLVRFRYSLQARVILTIGTCNILGELAREVTQTSRWVHTENNTVNKIRTESKNHGLNHPLNHGYNAIV